MLCCTSHRACVVFEAQVIPTQSHKNIVFFTMWLILAKSYEFLQFSHLINKLRIPVRSGWSYRPGLIRGRLTSRTFCQSLEWPSHRWPTAVNRGGLAIWRAGSFRLGWTDRHTINPNARSAMTHYIQHPPVDRNGGGSMWPE